MGLKPIQKWKTRVLGRRVLTILHFKWHPNTHHTLLPLPAFGTMGSVGRNLLRGCFSSGNGCQLNGQVRWLKELFYVLPVSSTARPTYAKTFSFKYNVSFPTSFLRINNSSIYWSMIKHRPGWQELVAFLRPQNIPSDLSESAYLQIFATKRDILRLYKNVDVIILMLF